MKNAVVLVLGLLVILVAYFYWSGTRTVVTEESVIDTIQYREDVYQFTHQNDIFSIQYSENADAARLVHNDDTYILNRSMTASGARYESEDGTVSFWEHQDTANITIQGVEYTDCVLVVDTKDATSTEQIMVDVPQEDGVVANPIQLYGSARGYWFFEGTAPVTVVDWDGLIIGEGYITAEGDWMTEEFVPFSGSIGYTFATDTPSSNGAIIFRNDNPSGLPENDASFEIPVVFEKLK